MWLDVVYISGSMPSRGYRTIVLPWMEDVYAELESWIAERGNDQVHVDEAEAYLIDVCDMKADRIQKAITHLEARGWVYMVDVGGDVFIRITLYQAGKATTSG